MLNNANTISVPIPRIKTPSDVIREKWDEGFAYCETVGRWMLFTPIEAIKTITLLQEIVDRLKDLNGNTKKVVAATQDTVEQICYTRKNPPVIQFSPSTELPDVRPMLEETIKAMEEHESPDALQWLNPDELIETAIRRIAEEKNIARGRTCSTRLINGLRNLGVVTMGGAYREFQASGWRRLLNFRNVGMGSAALLLEIMTDDDVVRRIRQA